MGRHRREPPVIGSLRASAAIDTKALRTPIRRWPEHLDPRAFFGVVFVQATAPPAQWMSRHHRSRDTQPCLPSRHRRCAPSTPNSATPARPHPLIRYNRPENRGGTERTGAFSCSTASLDHARPIHASHASTHTAGRPHHPVRLVRRPQRPPTRSRGRTGRRTARHRRARFWEDACHLYARRASGT